jgi:hypothetical protein
MLVRACSLPSFAACALAVAGCAPEVIIPKGAPQPASERVPPPPPPPSQHRQDGIVYMGAGGVGAGFSRQGNAKTETGGFAAVGSLGVGYSYKDWVIVGLRVDASVAAGDGIGDIAAHVAVFPGADRTGAVRDLQLFADGGVGGPLAQSGTSSSSSITGVGRVGVVWERFRLSSVSIGPWIAGQIARSAGDAQAAALAGVSLTFTSGPPGGKPVVVAVPPPAPPPPPPPPPP